MEWHTTLKRLFPPSSFWLWIFFLRLFSPRIFRRCFHLENLLFNLFHCRRVILFPAPTYDWIIIHTRVVGVWISWIIWQRCLMPNPTHSNSRFGYKHYTVRVRQTWMRNEIVEWVNLKNRWKKCSSMINCIECFWINNKKTS